MRFSYAASQLVAFKMHHERVKRRALAKRAFVYGTGARVGQTGGLGELGGKRRAGDESEGEKWKEERASFAFRHTTVYCTVTITLVEVLWLTSLLVYMSVCA